MTEQEYIDRGDQFKVECAVDILRDILPENSSIVDGGEFMQVMGILKKWEDEYIKLMDRIFRNE